MRQDLDLQQEQPLTTYGTTQSPKKRIVRLRCPAFTSEEWRAKNPLLQKGEFGVESDTYSVKVGDGVTRWLGLPYTSSTGGTAWGNIGGDINNQLDLTDALSAKANTADVQAMVDEAVGDITFDVFSVGQEGLVPAPTASDATKCLLGDGSWGTPGDIGGGDALPDQTDNAGKFLTTDGTTASWSEALVNKGTNSTTLFVSDISQGITNNWSVVLGRFSYCDANGVVVIGHNSNATGSGAIVIGENANATASNAVSIGKHASARARNAIQLGGIFGQQENLDANTFKVGNENGNFEMMDANGKVPLDRLTYVTDQIGDISTALTSILGE